MYVCPCSLLIWSTSLFLFLHFGNFQLVWARLDNDLFVFLSSLSEGGLIPFLIFPSSCVTPEHVSSCVTPEHVKVKALSTSTGKSFLSLLNY